MTSALLYYQHLCQRGKDHLCEDGLYEGTSKFAEGYGTSLVSGRAKEEGMNVTIHWMDKDSSSAKAIRQHYPDTKLDALRWTCCLCPSESSEINSSKEKVY